MIVVSTQNFDAQRSWKIHAYEYWCLLNVVRWNKNEVINRDVIKHFLKDGKSNIKRNLDDITYARRDIYLYLIKFESSIERK